MERVENFAEASSRGSRQPEAGGGGRRAISAYSLAWTLF